jgi:hypothetical protein
MAAREVFVSYSQPDREAAFELVTHVEAQGLHCWVAPRDVAPAADWAAEIIEAIAAARVMVLLFSASANTSPQVRREVERAVHRGVSVLPFRLADVMPSASLEYFLSSQHWLDAFPGPMEPHYARLCARLRGILGAQEPLAAAAPPHHAPLPDPGAMQAAHFDPEQLHRIEQALAVHIGPVARHLVGRAAAQAHGMEALIESLGTEIDSESERRRFVGACHAIVLGAR